jgi:hypothetical protein
MRRFGALALTLVLCTTCAHVSVTPQPKGLLACITTGPWIDTLRSRGYREERIVTDDSLCTTAANLLARSARRAPHRVAMLELPDDQFLVVDSAPNLVIPILARAAPGSAALIVWGAMVTTS